MTLSIGEPLRSEQIPRQTEAILGLYRKEGFIAPTVDIRPEIDPNVGVEKRFDSNKTKVDITIVIAEGVQTLVDQVTFDGLTAIDAEKAMDAITLKSGTPLREDMIRSDANTLKALIAAKGYPHVRIESDFTLSKDRSRALISHHVVEGPLVRLGHIHYQGDFRSRRKVLDREWALSSGEPLDPHRLLESQKNIRNLGIFNHVRYDVLGFEEQNEEVDLIVKLAERKPYFFEMGGGYESDRRLFISTRLVDRNLFGLNRRGWLSGELSQIGYRLESGIHAPRFFHSRLSMNFHGFAERYERFNQDFGTKKAGLTLALEQNPRKRIAAGVNLKYEYLDQFQKNSVTATPDSSAPAENDPRNVLTLTPRIQFDTRDSFIWPRKGGFMLGYIDFSRGLRNDLDDFLRYHLDLRVFWPPVKRLTMALIGRGVYIDPYNRSGKVSKDQLVYLGGITGVRGFSQNAMVTNANGDAVGGRKALYGSLEARIGLGIGWEMPIFIDAGWLDGIQEPGIESEVRLTAGTGLRYITPIGPIGILYGYKLNKKAGESAGVFHFSLGVTF